MPEVRFRVRWPDRTESLCYSPSRVVTEHLAQGASYPLDQFVELSTAALEAGSRRVAEIYGMGCGHAAWQSEEIRRQAERFRDWPEATVTVEEFVA